MRNKKLLTIGIPTYNRAKYLQSSLLSIFNQIENLKEEVEVIVSNNCSTDNTEDVVKNISSRHDFKYYKQDQNIGMTQNILKIANEYASGEFCWIIGDDDFIIQKSIQFIVDLIKNNQQVDFIYAKTGSLHVKDYDKYLRPFNTSALPSNIDIRYTYLDKWEELISPEYSIIFLGEIMACIFRKSIWSQYKIKDIDNEDLSTLETSYPHTLTFAHTFIGKKAIYIDTEIVIALDGTREWWGKVGYILVEHVQKLLIKYKEMGVSDDILKKCYPHYLNLSMPYAMDFLLNPRKEYRHKVNLVVFFNFAYIIDKKRFLKLAVKILGKKIRQLLRYFIRKIIKNKKNQIIIDSNLIIFKNNNVFHKDFNINGKVFIQNNGYIKIGSNFKANSGIEHNPIGGDSILRLIAYTKNAKLVIGNNVSISNSTFVCWNSIEIEDNVMIGGGVKIWDTNFHSLDSFIRNSMYDYDIKTSPIKIKENAFIGAGSFILKGVTIGRNSIIAAGSVVVKDIPDDVIAGGNPAKIIKHLK